MTNEAALQRAVCDRWGAVEERDRTRSGRRPATTPCAQFAEHLGNLARLVMVAARRTRCVSPPVRPGIGSWTVRLERPGSTGDGISPHAWSNLGVGGWVEPCAHRGVQRPDPRGDLFLSGGVRTTPRVRFAGRKKTLMGGGAAAPGRSGRPHPGQSRRGIRDGRLPIATRASVSRPLLTLAAHRPVKEPWHIWPCTTPTGKRTVVAR